LPEFPVSLKQFYLFEILTAIEAALIDRDQELIPCRADTGLAIRWRRQGFDRGQVRLSPTGVSGAGIE
jgi:hypothetical protein